MQTNQLAEMRDWYCTVLSAKPAFENEMMAFLAYDEEHHRIGLLSLDNYAVPDRATVGCNICLHYDSLWTLFENYEQLKRRVSCRSGRESRSDNLNLLRGPDGNASNFRWTFSD